MDIPSDVLKVWDKYGLPENVRRHCVKVAEVALKLADRFNVDKNAVKLGALLHDVGRAITHGLEHFIHTGEILRREGFDERIVRIAERHFACGITKEEAKRLGLNVDRDYVPETLEEKIVCMADNLVEGDREVSFEHFMRKLERLKREKPETAWFTEKTIERALRLKEELMID